MVCPQGHFCETYAMKKNKKEEIVELSLPALSPKELEQTNTEKGTPPLEETMEKHWGITIPKLELDITDQLRKPQLNVYLPLNLPFEKAKKIFKTEFIKRELRLHRGNVSQLAKFLELDRRSIHRAIKDLDIDVEEVRSRLESKEDYQKAVVDTLIRSALGQYKEIIQPQKMELLYRDVDSLSRNIARLLPPPELSWKQAELEFEKQLFQQAMEENEWKVSVAASKLKIRPETLHRKIKKLGIRKI